MKEKKGVELDEEVENGLVTGILREGERKIYPRGKFPRTSQIIEKMRNSRTTKVNRIQRYHVRACFLGALHWVDPCCGHINRTTLMQRRYIARCGKCRAQYVPKITLMQVPPGGRRSTPPDFIIPDGTDRGSEFLSEAFPMGDMGRWKQGQCVHDVQMDRSAEAFLSEYLNTAGSLPPGMMELAKEWQLEIPGVTV